tara:strand:+ start:69 stop:515 length:447 start_codon:yes stop_codon:yes gene_type:complete
MVSLMIGLVHHFNVQTVEGYKSHMNIELNDLDKEMNTNEVVKAVKQLCAYCDIEYVNLLSKEDVDQEVTPEAAKIIVSTIISEFSHILTYVPQLLGNTYRDQALRHSHQNCISYLMEYRSLLMDCELDKDNDAQRNLRAAANISPNFS